jgi:hypothetical protein
MELLLVTLLLIVLAAAAQRWATDSRDDFTQSRPRGLF